MFSETLVLIANSIRKTHCYYTLRSKSNCSLLLLILHDTSIVWFERRYEDWLNRDLIGIDGLKMDYVGEAITPLNWVDFIYNDHTPEINENFRHNIDPYGDTSQLIFIPYMYFAYFTGNDDSRRSLKSCAEYNTTKISNDVRRLELGRI
ncbi:hypothetical protein RCL_jg28389.t1 [Rhizophagus clarus]|uniref:Uncharacterized protein n=1 Tax=Rhizophagus clarus TaxID=94130 RepID=A0A8H3M655_9GLOM|nr:hypothetical protein RCL_jg28389.t1 [Rhizophagus clarus]